MNFIFRYGRAVFNGIRGVRLLLRIVLCMTCMCALLPAYSQVTVVPSKKKTVIDGKSFYLHTVKPGETLTSISKAYKILQRDIVFHNPDAFEGIRIGEELKIPVDAGSTPTVTHLQSALYIYHIAEKGQTVYWLTQNYNISQEELYKHNPELEHSVLQAGQVVTIPKKTGDETPVLKKQGGYVVHVVKRGETLFSIAKGYNVDLNEILEINPEIDPSNARVKREQEIKIPMSDANPISIPIETSQTDTVIIRQDIQTPDNRNTYSNDQELPPDTVNCVESTQNNFRIAMLLPWFLADNAPASPPDSGVLRDSGGRYRYKDGRYWIHPNSANALEFYQGALLAVDTLKKQGLVLHISVFDTMRDTLKMTQILQSPEMKNMDLIVGPFNTELVNRIAPFARENAVHYISPVAINAESVKNNPYLLQVNTGEINTVAPIVDYIAKQENIHITLIGNSSEADHILYTAYLNRLRATIADTTCLTAMQMRSGSLIHPARFLKKDKMNVVIMPVSDEAFVNLMTGYLHASVHNFKINLYGLAGWTKLVNLDLEYLHLLEFRYATAFHIDYNHAPVQRFLRQYRDAYSSEPTMSTAVGRISPYPYQFAFLGYDITCFFASVLQRYGRNFGQCLPYFRMPLLQSDFRFERTDPTSGYRNTHLRIYKYAKDYTITQENVGN